MPLNDIYCRIRILKSLRRIYNLQLTNLHKLNKYRQLNNTNTSKSGYFNLVAEGRSLQFIYDELIGKLSHRNKITGK